MGGLPIGSRGKGLCLLSGGLTPQLLGKCFRQGDMDFVYFDLGGEAQKSYNYTFFFLRQHWAHGSRAGCSL